jgi:dolichol-phosphate mannosyltransferase
MAYAASADLGFLTAMVAATPALDVLLPVHNEAETIEGTIRELYDTLAPRLPLRFIICEDGSRDGTQQVLAHLAQTYPIQLLTSEQRKGYSRAVTDGMNALQADYLLCLDSDGQCDPQDFGKFWDTRKQQDVAIGWRVQRSDSLLRRLLSRGFFRLYQLFFQVPVHDPSCPYVLAHKRVIETVVPELGEMQQGFWWEFVARVHRRGFSLREIPVHHRSRRVGRTQVYRLNRLPTIAYRHVMALFKIWFETRRDL